MPGMVRGTSGMNGLPLFKSNLIKSILVFVKHSPGLTLPTFVIMSHGKQITAMQVIIINNIHNSNIYIAVDCKCF